MWKTVKLSDIANISIGKTPPRGDKRYWDKEKDTKNIWLSIADMNSAADGFVSDSKEYVSDAGAALFKSVPANTLIMSFKLSIGKLAFTACELRTNEAIAALAIKNENQITKEYLKHFLSSLNWDKIAGDDEKVKGKTLNKAKLKELEIVVPPLAEQQRIVAKLDAAFAEIDLQVQAARETIKLFETNLSNLIDVKTSGDSSWTEYKVMDLGKVQTGNTPKTSQKDNYGLEIPFVKPPDFNLDGSITINEDGLSARGAQQSRSAPAGSVLMVCIGTIGKVGVVDVDVCFNQQINSLTPSEEFDAELIYWQMRGKRFQSDVIRNAGQATLPIINKSKWQHLSIFLPQSKDEQIEIRQQLRELNTETEKLIANKARKIENCEALKSAILAQELQSEGA